MTNNSGQKPQTQISQIFTQAVRTIAGIPALALKPGAKVPEIRIINRSQSSPDSNKEKVHPLLGDRYLLGRSSKSCDIVVRNPVVSQIHLSIERDRQNPRAFIIKDKNSTNGIYLGKRRIKVLPLRHGDTLTLGPAELAETVEISYSSPPPLLVRGLRYFLYGAGGITALTLLIIGIEWQKVDVTPLPPGTNGPVVVYSRDGQTPLQAQNNDVHRENRRLADFGKYLPNAVIASEDSRFYWHFGVDPLGILRAIITNLQAQSIREGASTVTQQVARSLYPEYTGRDNSAGRKLREMLVALKLETFYSKDDILKAYLNRVYLGVGNTGFEDAAQFYFEKKTKDLTLSEAATLVAILPAPNSYNPVQNYDIAVSFRNRVISRMASLGMISEQEASQARRSRIEVSDKAREALSKIYAPYFYSYVFQELRFLLGNDLATEGNFIVETGLDLQMQAEAEKALRDTLNTTGSSVGFSQGAIVTLDTRTGEVLAMVGGKDYAQSQFNRAVQAQRQPGSTFKAFAYAAALEQGISPGKTYSCNPLRWQGRSYRGCERSSGNIDMYRGMAQSENSVALRVARDAGLNRVVSMAQRLGVNSKLTPAPGLVLGQSEVNVLEITGSYGAFANNGVWNRPHAIKRIFDGNDCPDVKQYQNCRLIYTFEEDAEANQQVISPNVAQTMNTLFRGVVQGGTGGRAAIGLGEAGKTGTTDRNVDLWFIGYVPSRTIVTGIWLGNDDNSPTRGSSSNAAQLWRSYMSQVVQ